MLKFYSRFTKTPTLVNGFSNLYAMEVDPIIEHEDMGGADGMDSLFSELAGAIPVIDEAMSFAQMLKEVYLVAKRSVYPRTLHFDTCGTAKSTWIRSSFSGRAGTAPWARSKSLGQDSFMFVPNEENLLSHSQLSYFFLDLLDLDEEAGMIQKSTNQIDQNENAEEQANAESTNQTLMPDFMKPAHNQYVYRHANGLSVIGLAPSHIAFKNEGGITAVDFNVGKSDRSRIKVTGKQKKKLEMQLLNPLLWFRSQFLRSWRKFGRGNWRFYRSRLICVKIVVVHWGVKGEGMMQSYPQGYWIEDSKSIELELLKKALGFS
ncbi:ATPase ARSA2 [Glycine soja]|uniref:ATPase ARSA2 n=1 Tax=Glycine soja TaxID=3848 RepID=A0A445M0R4_GLYSO|nr:ATPase ARSA2 [Glycine soja]